MKERPTGNEGINVYHVYMYDGTHGNPMCRERVKLYDEVNWTVKGDWTRKKKQRKREIQKETMIFFATAKRVR